MIKKIILATFILMSFNSFASGSKHNEDSQSAYEDNYEDNYEADYDNSDEANREHASSDDYAEESEDY